MNDKLPPIIIIKRVKKKAEHHGGSWKIAYADFVTAMMAFFLLLWLLSLLNKYQLQGISNYFRTPLKEVFVQNERNNSKTPQKPTENVQKYKNGSQKSEATKAADSATPKSQSGKTMKDDGEKQAGSTQVEKPDDKEMQEMMQLKEKMEQDLMNARELGDLRQHLNFELTDDGIKIQLRDLENQPMFSLGKTDFESYAYKIMPWLSGELNSVKKRILIIGHTDSNPYDNEGQYTNWELSAERANATRRALVRYGMQPYKIIRIEGAADTNLLDKRRGENAINRRIEIIILNDAATKKLLNE